MAHVTVYVPEDLKARMGGVANCNWSSVAQQAFKDAIPTQIKDDAMPKIEHIDQIGGTPLIAFAVEAWMYDPQAGLIDDTITAVHWEDRAVVAYGDSATPIGIITYSKVDWMKKINIKLGYVRDQHRRRGVYRELWDALVVKPRELGSLGSTALLTSTMS